MRQIIYILCLINLISCINFILKAGIKSEDYCQKNDLYFSYKNCFFVNDLVPNFKDEFSLLIEYDLLAKCKINQNNFISSDFEILCKIEKYFGCMEGTSEIPMVTGVKSESIFLDNDNILNFEGFEDNIDLDALKGINDPIIYGGDIFLGKCYDKNYNFTISELSIDKALNITKELQFILFFKEPNNIQANCFIPPQNLTDISRFNVSCTVKTYNSTDCKLTFGNSDLTISRNPYSISYESSRIYFSNFAGSSTIIKLKGRNLLKFEEENDAYMLFQNSLIDYNLSKLNKDITFKITYEINNKTQKTNCNITREKNNPDIKCPINSSLIKDFTNLTIIKSPYIDRENIKNKSIKFEGFEDKKIYNIIAGPIQKGKVVEEEGEDRYYFQFINSDIPIEYNNFALEMSKGTASCKADNQFQLINCSIPFYQVEDDEGNIVVGPEDPEFIQIDDNTTLYFSHFARQDTYKYLIEVGNLIKDIINCTESKYYFKFNKTEFKCDNFDEDLYFNLNISYNNSNFIATCKIYSIDNNANENLELTCYFDLNEDLCQNEEISYYEIKINKGNDGIKFSTNYEDIHLVGFDDKETKTILVENIFEKYYQNYELFFKINYNYEYFSLNNTSFQIIFYNRPIYHTIKAYCKFEGNFISCNSKSQFLDDEYDIDIRANPGYIILNENQTLYYEKFKYLKTYTIIAGQIEKLPCDNENNYQFNLINSRSISKLSQDKNLNIKVKINDSEIIDSTCLLKKDSHKYNISCYMNKCPTYIELVNNSTEINNDLLFPYSLFYKEFNNKRAITIKSGKIKKGKCNQLNNEETSKYYFNITDNYIDYKYDEDISFQIKTKFGNEITNSTCDLNLSDKNNTAICSTELNNCDECDYNDITILEEINPDYNSTYPNSIFFENFQNLTTTTIIMNNTGMIIKEKDHFILSDNYINENNFFSSNEIFNITLKIKYLSENIGANCTIPKMNRGKLFNVSCYINDYSYEKEIEILEEPLNDNYYFYGYKNKKTLTLNSGSIIKENYNNKFRIINNEFNEEIKDVIDKNFELNLNINYTESNRMTTCDFNIKNLYDKNKINISCSIPSEINNSSIISVLENPKPLLLSDNKTCIYFINYDKLNLYTLYLGKIIKKGYDENEKKYIFYINNTKIAKNIDENVIIFIPILINEEEKQANCTLEKNSIKFNMKCEINNFENNSIDIKYYQSQGYFYYTNVISPNTLFIGNQTIISTTLTPGHIIKEACLKNIYKFNIINNALRGNKSFNISNEKFSLKLDQFNKNALCEIEQNENIVINCEVNIDINDENEVKCCNNMNYDIKINKVLGYQDNEYILLKNDEILHLYNFDNLQTYTLESGEIFKGKCYGNKYQFPINDNKIYNNLSNDDNDIEFNLELSEPEGESMTCLIPKNSQKDVKFNIICSHEYDDCLGKFYNKELTIGKNPDNLDFNGKKIIFKNFANKSTLIHINAGSLNLSEYGNNYILEFINSNIDCILNNDISFNMAYKLNDEGKTTICTINKDKTDIIECDLGNINSDNIIIKIESNPHENYDLISGKTILFENFSNKELHILTAGYIQKGCCNNKYYNFSFYNNSNINIDVTFYLQMKKPNLLAICSFKKNNNDNKNNYINCSIEGRTTCPVESDDSDIMVGENDPDLMKINESYVLKFSNFKNQNTFVYDIKVGNIKKGNIDGCRYYFDFNEFNIFGVHFYENEIIFEYDIYLNDTKFDSICKIYENTEIEKYVLECYFDLDENYCSLSEDELLDFDLRISDNVDGKRNASKSGREINLIDFNNKQTVTLFAENIIDKKVENNQYIFIIKTKSKDEIEFLKNKTFNIDILNNDNNISSICQINENNNIECISSKQLSLTNDIKIKSNPDLIVLYNTNYTYYFTNFQNLRTYSLSVGKLQKYRTKSGNNYIFRILNCRSPYIPLFANISLNILINETIYRTAICYLQNLTNYSIRCELFNESYIPYDIIIPDDSIKMNTNLFYPDTIFFYNFGGKRTLTLKPGKLNRGQCNTIEDKIIYDFNFTNNEFYYYINRSIEFSLSINYNEDNYTSFCKLNLSNKDNDIICSLENVCPKDFKINNNPSIDYYYLPNATIIYEDFVTKEIVTIVMNPDGKIIKRGLIDDKYRFIITNNSVLGNKIISENIEFDLNINDKNTFANCLIPKSNENKIFDISCYINNGEAFMKNSEIEIIEEPDDNTYYFSGYKNKKTLTLEAGVLMKNKDNENIFYIINNKFMSNYTQFEDNDFEIALNIKYSENEIYETLCSFNPKNIMDNYINISCSIPEAITNIKYIKVLNTPEAKQLNQNVTLNYDNFNKLNLYSISLGNIIKDKCETESYIFYFANTTISSPSQNYNLTIPIHFDKNQFNSWCEIQENKTLFNMKCIINNYCPDEYIDIEFNYENFYVYDTIYYKTIYIENNYVSTSTLKPGYIKKKSCENNLYNFSIINNNFTGNTDIKLTGEFTLKLKEFNNNAKCEINDININCEVNLENNEEEYCNNMNKDINIEKIYYEEYHYILINDNINVLHLYYYENLGTHTVEAGDLIKGNCTNNIYEFKIIDSLLYNNLVNPEKNIQFNLRLSQPKELISICTLPKDLKPHEKFDINCEINEGQGSCPIDVSKGEEIKIKSDPEDLPEEHMNFKNFEGKSILITINAGLMSKSRYDKENKKYYFIFNNSTITSSLKKDISFKIKLNTDNQEKTSNCNLNHENLSIQCNIENIETENINIKILENPPKDIISIPEKIIIFQNFENKQINYLIAGKIQKGTCKDSIYSFYFMNSINQINFNNEFYLQVSEPSRTAICNLINFDVTKKTCDIKCSFDAIPTCESDYEGKDIIISNKEPDPLRIDDNYIMYFDNFREQNTIVYNIEVGNLLKGDINKEECKYYFNFDNDPYKLPNFKETIIFNFTMYFNNSEVLSTCLLKEFKNGFNVIDYKNVDLLCYFSLNHDICSRNDLLNYDLRIGKDINNKKIVNSSQEIILTGFDKKETMTILGKNIINKYAEEENNKLYFIINFKTYNEITDNVEFNMNFYKNEEKTNYKANCIINSQNILCENNNSLTIDDDILIISNPDYIKLNLQTIYFLDFENKKTYTIKGGQIEKKECLSSQNYKFNLINTSSKSVIPLETNITINVLINDKEEKIAICSLERRYKYNMSCIIKDVICPRNIILNNKELKPDETIYYPNTLFFNDFNNKRTIIIKSGNLKKGLCDLSTNKYNYTFTNNEIDYNINKDIHFTINTISNGNKIPTNCYINQNDEDNIIKCSMNFCPNKEEHDLTIESNPNADYTSLNPNSIFFEDFKNKNTTSIIMESYGIIIKEQNRFILTDNYIIENDIIYTSFNIIIKLKINEEEKEANCVIPEVNKGEIFNISCYINDYSYENDIEILEDPVNDNYYFYGYKNKKTWSLTAGSLIKSKTKNEFEIINSKLSESEYYLIDTDINFEVKVKYNTKESYADCLINKDAIYDYSNITIICSIAENIDIKNISLLTNPQYIRLNNNITLYFINFQNLNLYTITPGDILKGKCESNTYIFYLINTEITNSLSRSKSIQIPIIVNKEQSMQSICEIKQNEIKFNMTCTLENYCPNDNIDIKIESLKISNKDIINPNTLYINIPSEKETSTLNVGNLEKVGCQNENGNYTLRIKNSNYTGKDLNNKQGQFKLKLYQFNQEVNCYLNIDRINCWLLIDKDSDYCTNIYQDIKVEKLIGDNDNKDDYIILNKNDIVHLYGIKNLETFTIEGGELNQGYCNDKIYIFNLNNSLAYNDISTGNNLKFNLNLMQPKKLSSICSLPLNINKGKSFDINCYIYGEDECPISVEDSVIRTGTIEPDDINYNNLQLINFNSFMNKDTKIVLTASNLELGNKETYNYYILFTNSSLEPIINLDISFLIKINLNNEEKELKCTFYRDSKNIKCDIQSIPKTYDLYIRIPKNPDNDISAIKGKTIIFNSFENKEIYTFVAGLIEKGHCESNNKYVFYFRNCTTQMHIKSNLEFDLVIKYPNSISNCITEYNKVTSFYDVKCIIGEKNNKCIVESDEDDITISDDNPLAKRYNDLKILYYFNFANQSTVDTSLRYYLNGGIITKQAIQRLENNNYNYIFNIKECSINQPLNESYNLNIPIQLSIYENSAIKINKYNSICNIPKDIKNIDNFDISCSFSTNSSFFAKDNNYDILIENGEEEIIIKEDQILYISNIYGLFTQTMYGCNIEKGNCDTNNKYNYKFYDCKNKENINLDFTLKVKDDNEIKNSICVIDNNENDILCYIENYSLCKKGINDVLISDKEPEIDYIKYPSNKSFYIIELINLYTTTLTGGNINLGKCDSTNFIFNFSNSNITNILSNDISFNLSITEPLQTNSLCIIPKNSENFDLKCTIQGKDECPISDKTLLKFEEISEEKKFDLIRPNALYINNLYNKKITRIKAGYITKGKCNNNKYEFNFTDTEIYGDIKSDLEQDIIFSLNMENPQNKKAYCILPKNMESNSKINMLCYIEGGDRCPMFDNTYIKIKDNPEIDETLISPYTLVFSGFENQAIIFDNYYIDINNIEGLCIDDNYDFNITTKFNSDNIQSNESFYIDATADKNSMNYKCNFPDKHDKATTGKIICKINGAGISLDNDLKIYFDLIYLQEKNIYIVNQNSKKEFILNNIQCPLFSFDQSTDIQPGTFTTNKSLSFSMDFTTSFKNKKPIKIYDESGKEKTKNILEYKLKSSSRIKTFYRFLNLNSQTEFTTQCQVPKETDTSIKINCLSEDITDTKSDYFTLETSDHLEVNDKKVVFNLKNNNVKNPYKSNDSPDDKSKDSDSISTAGKIILIIVIVLVFVALILTVIYYFCFRNRNNGQRIEEESGNKNNNESGANPDNNRESNNNQSGNSSNSNSNSNNNDSSNKTSINPNDNKGQNNPQEQGFNY